MLLEKDGKNVMIENGKLSGEALKMIAGILDVSDALTAFGNTIPTSYLRLVPGQEAPTKICWGDRNRSVLIRVPLGWSKPTSMINLANPQDSEVIQPTGVKQTVEFRAPDGSAEIYSLLAGLVMGAFHGFNMPDALQRAEKLYVDGDIFSPERREEFEQLMHLPESCWESAEKLLEKREIFEHGNVFPPKMIDALIAKLQSFHDKDLSEKLQDKTEEIRKLVIRYIHCM
jgi:glutamine synthetase